MTRTWKKVLISFALSLGLVVVALPGASYGAVSTGATTIFAQFPAHAGAGGADITQLSCPSAASCVGVGIFQAVGEKSYVFSVHQVHGKWTAPVRVSVPGFVDAVTGLSCPNVMNCAVSGYSSVGVGIFAGSGWVVSEINGVWQSPDAPFAPVDTGTNQGEMFAVSCGGVGACVAVGQNSTSQYMISSSDGVWGQPDLVGYVSGPESGTATSLNTVVCPSAGNCTAAGSYLSNSIFDVTGASAGLIFTMDEVNGAWGDPTELPGFAALNDANEQGALNALSCGSVGNCAIGGNFTQTVNPTLYDNEPFVASEIHGVWQNAIEVPGIAARQHGPGQTEAISCYGTTCTAAGVYGAGDNKKLPHYGDQAFAATAQNGVWGSAQPLFISAADATGWDPTQLSCSTQGCFLIGGVGNDPGGSASPYSYEDFADGVVSLEIKGRWTAPAPDAVAGGWYQQVSIHIAVRAGGTHSLACSNSGYCVVGGAQVYAQHGYNVAYQPNYYYHAYAQVRTF